MYESWLTPKEKRELALTTYNGHKLQAVKNMMAISEAKLGKENKLGLKECKDFIDALPPAVEDAVLDIRMRVETIERLIAELPDLIVDAIPSVDLERATMMAYDPTFGELKKRIFTASNATKFGL